MLFILLYSALLLAGLVVSQTVDLSGSRDVWLDTLTMTGLSYIMLEVGLEFTIDKTKIKSYGVDFIVAATAAAIPWVTCVIYFMAFMDLGLFPASVLGCFAAPTSAGVLFTMLAAAGLGSTWIFRKARVLAIFDDLDIILFMIPLQICLTGFHPKMVVSVVLMVLLLGAAYRWLHVLRWPAGKLWILAYGVMIVSLCQILESTTHIVLEVLLPTFVLGCVLYNPHDPNRPKQHPHEHQFLEPERGWTLWLDHVVKGGFMFLVGCSLPQIEWGSAPPGVLAMHVIILTVLINLGKCFPLFCYKDEVPLRERLALSVAMFPRGEVGAGVLLISIAHGIKGPAITTAILCLTLNLLLTGVFISIVIWLINSLVPGTNKSLPHNNLRCN